MRSSNLFSVASLYVISPEQKEQLKKLGDRLRTYRTKKGLSQAQVAYEMGISETQYQRIEYGTVNTGVLNIYKLSEILDVQPGEILNTESAIN